MRESAVVHRRLLAHGARGSLMLALLALAVALPAQAAKGGSVDTTFLVDLGKVSPEMAAALGLNGEFLSTVTNGTIKMGDVMRILQRTLGCSGRYCVDLAQYLANTPTLPDINANVLLWSPKLPGTPAGQSYDPSTKDWNSVVSMCRALIKAEKRLGNFIVRSTFHDSLSVDVSVGTPCPGPMCGGADSSLLLTVEELLRPENAYDGFAAITSRAIKKIASFYDVSVADTLAVCGAVAPEVLSNGRFKILGHKGAKNLRMGRLDSVRPAPPEKLPAEHADLAAFAGFWKARGFSMEEAMALMGSHALVDEQACFKGPGPKDYCDPSREDCSNVRMFRWENHYFLDLATPTVKVTRVAPDHVVQEETPILGMTEPEMQAEIGHETCKFTSKEFKSQAINVLRLIQTGQMVDPDTEQPPPPFDVDWSNEDCTKAKKAKEAMCPHPTNWWYTINDGFLALAVQGGEVEDAEADAEGADVEQLEKLNGVKETKEQKQAREAAAKARKEAYNHPDAKAVREAVYDFHKHDKWDEVYRSAYIKMVSLYTTYSPIATARPFHINGAECPSGITMEPACAQDQEGPASSDVTTLWNGGAMCQRRVCGNQCCSIVTIIWDKVFNKKNVNCDNCCICATAVRELMYNNSNGQVERQTFATRFPGVVPAGLNTDPLPAAPNAAVPVIEHDSYEMDDHITPNIKVNGGFSDPPYSPFVDPSSVCPHTHGISVRVEGYPSSPWRWSPFTRPYAKPAIANVSRSWCKSGDSGMCVDAFEIDIFVSSVDLGCPAGRTRVLSYNGTMPGPTIRMLKGRQSLVRFNNRLTDEKVLGSKFKPHPPCSSDEGRKGRPISVHHHGEASLAPYDGWAEDSTCGGESKDYYYPNRRPGFAWYHDHQLEITSENAYYGLSGMYIVHDKGNEGGCGEPWNMDALPDLEMQLKDAVLDKQCQLYFDREDDHKENLYGDVNLVNGVPWPVMTVDPRWHRFRWVNSAVTRPFKLRIVDEHGEDVSSSACLVVAGEGGVRREPAPFPPGGLFIGVAERYEVVCDLTNHAGRTLFVWNQKDERRMKHVPFFCYSHLVSKIRVKPCPNGQSTCAPPGSAFAATAPARPALDAVLSESDIQAAQDMIRERRCTRIFKFGRRRGQWVINGETWHTMRVAAGNVGQNTWEVWCLETGGGWFHPIHIHLVDFYVLARNREFSKVHDYEKWTPKDVVQLDPSAEVALLLRFGPHRGEYMFHCHNLVHEDTEMMRSFHIKHTNVSRAAPTALPMQQHPSLIQNLNTIYDLYDDPVTPRFGARETKKLPPLTNSQSGPWVQFPVTNGIYRIFYPGGAPGEDPRLSDPSVNPWRVNTCQLQRPRP